MKRLALYPTEVVALTSAPENYLDGIGMRDGDEDEAALQRILDMLDGAPAVIPSRCDSMHESLRCELFGGHTGEHFNNHDATTWPVRP